MVKYPEIKEQTWINAKEVHKFIQTKTRFRDWISRCIDHAELKEGSDFRSFLSESTGGRPAKEYELSINAVKECCIISGTGKAKKLRRWLISLSNEVESGQRLTHEQIMWTMKMVKVFAIYEYRKAALNKNADNFVNNSLLLKPELAKNTGQLYGQFHQWRNEVLQTGKDTLETRLKEYCLLERRRLPSKFTQDEALTMLGDYENIKNAVWDLLLSHNKSEEMANNIANLAQEIAKEMKPFLQRLNESNLFFQKIDNKEIKSIGL